MMRRRIGYPNPTVRIGHRHVAVEHDVHAPTASATSSRATATATRCTSTRATARRRAGAAQIAPPGFEATMGYDRSPVAARRARAGDARRVAGRAAVPLGQRLAVLPAGRARRCARSHAGRRPRSRTSRRSSPGGQRDRHQQADVGQPTRRSGQRPTQVVRARRAAQREGPLRPTRRRPPKDQPASYTDEQLAEIEAAYDAEFVRGRGHAVVRGRRGRRRRCRRW